MLAGGTGGFVIAIPMTCSAAERIARSDQYYILAYTPPNPGGKLSYAAARWIAVELTFGRARVL